MKKIVKKIVLIVAVIIFVLIGLFYLFSEQALKVSIETGATKALNVGVNVDKVGLSVLAGELSLDNLVINNPAGYENKKFLQLGSAEAKVAIGSLLSDVVNINKIRLDGINLTLEQKGINSNNLSDIIKNMPSDEKDKGQKPKPTKPSKKLLIEDLEITNITVNVKLLPIPGKKDTLTLKLPPIKMQNIGAKEDVDVGDLSKKILAAIAEKISESGAGILPEGMLGDIKGQLESLSALPGIILEESGKILEEGGKLPKDIIESGKEIGEGLKEGIGGIFGPKDKK